MTTRYKYVRDDDGDYAVYNPHTEKLLGWLRRDNDPAQPWSRDFFLIQRLTTRGRCRDEAVQAAINDAYVFIAEAKEGLS